MNGETNPCSGLPDKLLHITQSSCSENGVIGRGIHLQRRNKQLSNGDFVIPKGSLLDLDEPVRQEIRKAILQQCNDAGIPIHAVDQDRDSSFVFRLDRCKCFHLIIKEVIEKRDKFGLPAQHSDTVLLNAADFFKNASDLHELSLPMLRCLIILQHLIELVKARGYRVKCNEFPVDHSLKCILEKVQITLPLAEEINRDSENVICEELTEKCRVSKYSESFDSSSKDSRTSESVDDVIASSQVSDIQDCENNQHSVVVNLKHFIEDNNLVRNKNGFFKDLCFAQALSNGQPTKCLEQVISLEASLKKCFKKDKPTSEVTCIHLVSDRNLFSQQQSGLLWDIFSNKEIKFRQLYLPYGSVIIMKNEAGCADTLSAEDFYRLRFKQLKDAAVMKYGEEVKGTGWNETISSLTSASMKFDLLSNGCRNNVKLNLSESKDEGLSSECRVGAFVMYNCARLATLFDHFSTGVQKGKYPPLPDIDEVNFNLLRAEDEWTLFFNFILPYPEIVENSVDLSSKDGDIYAHIQTHKISNFLISLSRYLSSYYSRTHVLVEPHKHLLRTMFARIYLLKAVHQVMKNALHLMGIQPIGQL